MATIERFEDIEAWKTARILCQRIYFLSGRNQFKLDYGLRDQIRRAAVSIMSNIAEGFESRTQRLFIDYLGHARGSAGEVRSQLYIALDLKYLSTDEFNEVFSLVERCSRQIYNFIEYLNTRADWYRVREDPERYDD